MHELLVLTAADGSYFPYALPYATSVLHYNKDCVVEIFVPDSNEFNDRYKLGIETIRRTFGDRLVISGVEFSVPGSIIRFIAAPSAKAKYVYIGDIDILILEEIAPKHKRAMQRHGLRYSNEVRSSFLKNGVNKMTGLHFSEYDFYYPVEVPADVDLKKLRWNSDEDLLYRIVAAKTEPRVGDLGRPMHGFHMSQHGWPYNQWGVMNPAYRRSYGELSRTPAWAEMRELFDPRYVVYLEILEAAIKGCEYFTDEEIKASSMLYGRGAKTHLA
jgi:hypothetical protein